MSKTDNTRPYELQAADLSVPGGIYHRHVERRIRFEGSRRIEQNVLLECDYDLGNNLHDYHVSHVIGALSRQKGVCYTRCSRRARYYGGMNFNGGATKDERKFRRRSIRRRERQALYRALWSEDREFDLLPIREDARTILWDLS